MDVGKWRNSANKNYVRFLSSAATKGAPVWSVLWRKVKKEKSKILSYSKTSMRFKYDMYSYQQNFDERLPFDNSDDLLISFSARFAVPSAIFQEENGEAMPEEKKMPKQFHKTIQDYFSKIKKPSTSHLNLPSKSLTSSTSWILRGCKHPKTSSFSFAHDKKIDPCSHKNHDLELDHQQDQDNGSATLSDIDRFLIENFKSLYEKDHLDHKKNENQENEGSVSFSSPKFDNPPSHDLCSSHRFFINPGSSGSVIEDSGGAEGGSTLFEGATSESSHEKKKRGADDFIAILTYSSSPCVDFRNSMQEMIEARLHHNGKVDWEFMKELLLCYLNLNDDKSHKYILSAFVDLVVLLRENSGKGIEDSRNAPARFRDVKKIQEEKRKEREM